MPWWTKKQFVISSWTFLLFCCLCFLYWNWNDEILHRYLEFLCFLGSSLLTGRCKRDLQKLIREDQKTSRNITAQIWCSDHEIKFFQPNEIIFEILIRLTVKSVSRCKCVCKTWYVIVEERKFIEEQMNRSDGLWVQGKGTCYRRWRILMAVCHWQTGFEEK